MPLIQVQSIAGYAMDCTFLLEKTYTVAYNI